jgi:hypothetical protein
MASFYFIWPGNTGRFEATSTHILYSLSPTHTFPAAPSPLSTSFSNRLSFINSPESILLFSEFVCIFGACLVVRTVITLVVDQGHQEK